MIVVDRKEIIAYEPNVYGENIQSCSLAKVKESDSIEVFSLEVPSSRIHQPLKVKWKIKGLGVKASWSSNVVLNKRFRTDWELPQVVSSISDDLPILALIDHFDHNVITVACADAVNQISLELSFREEDNHFYCTLTFFGIAPEVRDYKTLIYIDKGNRNFNKSISCAASWIFRSNSSIDRILPDLACAPLYSTWYSFHQSLDEALLLQECTIAKDMGYELIIIDDGWQTMDDNRGYDYTGDWRPDRFKDVSAFVDQVHALGMGIMFWFSVPFCGKKSKAYQMFKGKFLTENHHWAPVFDPRFPEVRHYLVNIYKQSLEEWGIDGLKLDFIDDFRIYPETELKELNGRDTLSVFEGVQKLINEIYDSLISIKEDVLIEFRQKYIGPALRPLGNMFRAFDCPNDSVMNRVRTTDVKLISGNAAVHSDMFTWHTDESPEVAALQLTNVLFSVPQLSVRLAERDEETLEMIRFYTQYWTQNQSILMEGDFTAYKPLSNYPILSSSSDTKIIYGLYDDVVLTLSGSFQEVDIVNGKLTEKVIVDCQSIAKDYSYTVFNCLGHSVAKGLIDSKENILAISCPPNGLIKISM